MADENLPNSSSPMGKDDDEVLIDTEALDDEPFDGGDEPVYDAPLPAAPRNADSRVWMWVGIGAGVVLVIVLLVWLLSGKSKNDDGPDEPSTPASSYAKTLDTLRHAEASSGMEDETEQLTDTLATDILESDGLETDSIAVDAPDDDLESKLVEINDGFIANSEERPDRLNEACYTRLTEDMVSGMTSEELRLLRNTIYARHGLKFKDASVHDHFSQYSWYKPSVNIVDPADLTETERANITLISRYE